MDLTVRNFSFQRFILLIFFLVILTYTFKMPILSAPPLGFEKFESKLDLQHPGVPIMGSNQLVLCQTVGDFGGDIVIRTFEKT